MENSQCIQCKNFKYNRWGVSTCNAFKEIPNELLFGTVKHDKPYPGDNGIMFDPIPELVK